VLTKDKGNMALNHEENGYDVIRFNADSISKLSWQAAAWLLRNQKAHRFDVIHIHGAEGFVVGVLRRFCAKRIPPVVLTLHTLRKYQYTQYTKYDLFALTEKIVGVSLSAYRRLMVRSCRPVLNRDFIIERQLCRLADMITPVASYIEREVQREYGVAPQRILPVLNGVDCLRIAENLSREKSHSLPAVDPQKTLLYVGRNEFSKGIQDLIIALSRLQKVSTEPVRLVIIGDGGAKDLLKELARALAVQDDVIFLSHVPHDEIFQYYAHADLFVLPSYSEGLPKVVLEAMASETAVVASDIDSHIELIDSGLTGYLFKTGNANSLASVILSALGDDNKREDIIRNAKAMVEAKYTWQAVTKRLDKVYERLLTPSI